MDMFYIKQWQEKKGELRKYFQRTTQGEYDEYGKILEVLLTVCVCFSDENGNGWDLNRIVEIRTEGHYSGDIVFVIPTVFSDIKNYAITAVEYGSCTGCDTLCRIQGNDRRYKNALPTESQVDNYMNLSLHLVQKMKRLHFLKVEDL